MDRSLLRNVLDTLWPAVPESIHIFWVVLWLVVVSVLCISVLALTISRWGRSQPVRICVVLSLLAHVLLAGYAATIHIAAASAGPPQADIELTFDDAPAQQRTAAATKQVEPWERMPRQPLTPPEQAEVARMTVPGDAPLVADRVSTLSEAFEDLGSERVDSELPGIVAEATEIMQSATATNQQDITPVMADEVAPQRATPPSNSEPADDRQDASPELARIDIPAVNEIVPEIATGVPASSKPAAERRTFLRVLTRTTREINRSWSTSRSRPRRIPSRPALVTHPHPQNHPRSKFRRFIDPGSMEIWRRRPNGGADHGNPRKRFALV